MSQDHTNEIKENRFILALVLTGLIYFALTGVHSRFRSFLSFRYGLI